MNITPHLLKATGRLNQWAEVIETIVHKSIGEITKALPVSNVDIILYDNPEGAIEHIGIGGYTPHANLVFISLDPQIDNFTDKLQTHLGRQIAHELHHAIRWNNPGYGETLLEALVTEGLGDAFSYELFPGELEAWDKSLTDEQSVAMKNLAKQKYNETYNHADWFFGSETMPKWTGYTLGYELVSTYISNKKMKASELYATSAQEFV